VCAQQARACGAEEVVRVRVCAWCRRGMARGACSACAAVAVRGVRERVRQIRSDRVCGQCVCSVRVIRGVGACGHHQDIIIISVYHHQVIIITDT